MSFAIISISSSGTVGISANSLELKYTSISFNKKNDGRNREMRQNY